MSVGSGPYDPSVTESPAEPRETIEYSPCGPSSEKLVTDVANFMERADEIVEHPLAQQAPNFDVLLHFDPATAAVAT